MGHQFPRAVVAAAVALACVGCGGSDGDGDPPPVLDVAREQVADARASDPATTEPTGASAELDGVESAPVELPAPDPSSFEGAIRVVNLFVEGLDAPTAIDVWGRRTFTNGPVLLVENIGFGEASGYFAAPAGYDLVIVSAGAGPDGEERAELFGAAAGERITTVFTNDDDDPARAVAVNVHEQGSDRSPAPPGDGNGLAILFAPNLAAFSDELVTSVGGEAFFVGDGSATCRPQRIETTGEAAHVLGGLQKIELELAPGPSLISLHPAPFPTDCDQPAAFEVTVDVVAGQSTTLLVYTADGVGIEALALPTRP